MNSGVPAPILGLQWRVLTPLLLVSGFGLLVLYSAANGHLRPWALSQGLRFFAFLAGALALSRVSLDWWRRYAFHIYGFLVVMLVLVEVVGGVSGGSQRWIGAGPLRFQPSELMKLSIVIAVARFYEILPAAQTRTFNAIWPACALIGVPALLVMAQPDLGTGLMICMGGLTIMFLAGIPLRLFVGGAAVLAVAAPLAFNFVLHDYQRNRVLIFLDPESDPLGTGYHISQSKIAIGSGGIFGKGFLNGTQSHLDYLPEGHTDFVFATMAEEWGLLGGIFVIAMFLWIIRWGVNVGVQAENRFAKLAAAGLATTIFIYMGINLAMVMGLAPVVGIPLPLFSFGGSAQMTVLISIGILMGIDRSNRRSTRW
jgi:rod shape determining protein RodA